MAANEIKPKQKNNKLRLTIKKGDMSAPTPRELTSEGYSLIKEKKKKDIWEKETEPTKAVTKRKYKAGEEVKAPLGEGWKQVEGPRKGTIAWERTKETEKPILKSTISSAAYSREYTPEELKTLERMKPNTNIPQYAQEGGNEKSQEKQRVIASFKVKKEKSTEDGPSYTGKEKREARRAERQASGKECRFGVGCKVGRNRVSRARY